MAAVPESRRDTRDFKRASQRSTPQKAAPTPQHGPAGRRNAQPNHFSIEQEVRTRLAENEMTPEVRERMNRCVLALEEVVLRLGPNWRVSPFGSAANGFGTKFSDLDATCYELPPEEGKEPEQPQQPAAEVLSERLAPLLREHPEFTMAQEVLHARVPILKLCFEGKLEVDLSCHNTLPLQNTKLLKAYSALDERVRDLVIIVKLWAKDRGVCGASLSHLSSYALTLMAIYFMQVHPKIQLPMLPPNAFKEGCNIEVGAAKVEAARNSWKCSLSLGQFVLRFFNFYSLEFAWGAEVVSVRLPNRLDASESHVSKLKGRAFRRLHVEDPVDETRNLNCVLGDMQELELQRALQDTYSRLSSSESVCLGTPLQKLPFEEYAGAELASSPGRTTIKVFEHLLPSCPEEAEGLPPAVEAPHGHHGAHEAEALLNARQHSLSEASTAASCASSTDEANYDDEAVSGSPGMSTEQEYIFEKFHEHAPSMERTGFRPSVSGKMGPGLYGSRDLRKASPDGYYSAEDDRSNAIMAFLQNQPEKQMSGQMAGQQLLQMIKPKTESSENGLITAQPSARYFPRLMPTAQPYDASPEKVGQSSFYPSPPAPPQSQQQHAAQTAQLPSASPAPEPSGQPRRSKMTKNIMAKVMMSCEAHNKDSEDKVEEKVWQ